MTNYINNKKLTGSLIKDGLVQGEIDFADCRFHAISTKLRLVVECCLMRFKQPRTIHGNELMMIMIYRNPEAGIIPYSF